MSDSLKDQLLALGLTPKKSVTGKGKQQKTRRPVTKARKSQAEIPLEKAYRIRDREERQQSERAAALKREQERKRRETNEKIRAMVKSCAIRDEDADIKRNFLFKGRIRSVLANPDQLAEINNGSLGVVYLSGNYHLMPMDKIEEIREFAPDHIPDLAGAENEEEAENPVPDDLIW